MRIEYNVVPKHYPSFSFAIPTMCASEEQARRIAKAYDDEQAAYGPWRILRIETTIVEREVPR